MVLSSKLKPSTQPWCVVRSLPDQQQQVIARFHRHNDAEGYLQVQRRQSPLLKHDLVFLPTEGRVDPPSAVI